MRDCIDNAGRRCQTIPGTAADAAIGQLLLDTLTPLTLEVALTVQAVDPAVVEMYRVAVDQATRNDIAAAAAAHHELGRDYDDAVAEGLIDRIGAEIDRRVEARLGPSSRGSRLPAEIVQVRRQALWVGAGVGAGLTGIVA